MNKLHTSIYFTLSRTQIKSNFFQKRKKNTYEYQNTNTYEYREYQNKLFKREQDYEHEIERIREKNAKLASQTENQNLNTKRQNYINNTVNRYDYIKNSIQLIQEVLLKK